LPEITEQPPSAELPEDKYRALVEYAVKSGLEFDQAVMRLAMERLDEVTLGRRLKVRTLIQGNA